MLVAVVASLLIMSADAAAPATAPWATPAPQASNTQPAPRLFELKRDDEINGFSCETRDFIALVFPDGSVDFRRAKRFAGGGARFLPFPFNYLPEPLPEGTPSVAGEIEKLLSKRKTSPAKTTGVEAPKKGAPYLFADTTSLCEDPKSRCFFEQRGTTSVVSAVGPMDVTDEVMRMLGEDSSRYEKARFLAATAPFRMKLAEQTRKRELQEALNDLPETLNRIWRTPSFTRDERLKLIAALRDDVDVTAPGGEAALAAIDAFIKKRTTPSLPIRAP